MTRDGPRSFRAACQLAVVVFSGLCVPQGVALRSVAGAANANGAERANVMGAEHAMRAAGAASALKATGAAHAKDPKKWDGFGVNCEESFPIEIVRRIVTSLVFVSPRPQDKDGSSLKILKEVISGIKDVLQLRESQIIVAFDGVSTDLPYPAQEDYLKKISEFEQWNLENHIKLEIWKNKGFTHQAEMMHRIFADIDKWGDLTPYLFVTRDNTPVTGPIDVPSLMKALGCDKEVDYVEFLGSGDCSVGPSGEQISSCTAHPTLPWLQRVDRMSDRPHFCTASFYTSQVFPDMAKGSQAAPFNQHTWMYGNRHEMKHLYEGLE